jgi:acetate kinase
MHLLVVNSGSSSIKFSVFETVEGREPRSVLEGELAGVGRGDAELTMRPEAGQEACAKVDATTPEKAIQAVVAALDHTNLPAPDAVGYRVVHPGAKLDRHVRISDEVLQELDEAAEFAPLHDPVAVEMIRAMMKRRPETARFACFDTVFHETMPEEARVYALPQPYRDAGVRRYGFHGLSCESIVHRVRVESGGFPKRAVIAHLGSGCSVTALVDGRSVDTTMGLTPAGGVVMGTRPGDLDPGVVLYMLRQQKDPNAAASAVEKMLNHDAGIAAISGMANDVKAVRETAAHGNAQALLALQVFTRSVRKAIGAYAWLLGGLDAIFFSGGIGEHDALTRKEVLSGLEGLGIELEDAANEAKAIGVRKVSSARTRTEVWTVPAEEDLMIAIHVERMVRAGEELNERLEPRGADRGDTP